MMLLYFSYFSKTSSALVFHIGPRIYFFYFVSLQASNRTLAVTWIQLLMPVSSIPGRTLLLLRNVLMYALTRVKCLLRTSLKVDRLRAFSFF